MDERTRWNERYRSGNGPRKLNPRLARYLPLLKRGRALDLAGGIGQNSALLREWSVVLVDLSDEALTQAAGQRVLADAGALPFPPSTFDTIVDTYFFDPRVDFFGLLKPAGTLFIETYTNADVHYRPEFCPAHRLNLEQIAQILAGLEILLQIETDDGHRVFATIIARKPVQT